MHAWFPCVAARRTEGGARYSPFNKYSLPTTPMWATFDCLILHTHITSYKLPSAYHSLPPKIHHPHLAPPCLLQVLAEEMSVSGIPGQFFNRSAPILQRGGPAILVYYSPAFVRTLMPTDALAALSLLAEVYRCRSSELSSDLMSELSSELSSEPSSELSSEYGMWSMEYVAGSVKEGCMSLVGGWGGGRARGAEGKEDGGRRTTRRAHRNPIHTFQPFSALPRLT